AWRRFRRRKEKPAYRGKRLLVSINPFTLWNFAARKNLSPSTIWWSIYRAAAKLPAGSFCRERIRRGPTRQAPILAKRTPRNPTPILLRMKSTRRTTRILLIFRRTRITARTIRRPAFFRPAILCRRATPRPPRSRSRLRCSCCCSAALRRDGARFTSSGAGRIDRETRRVDVTERSQEAQHAERFRCDAVPESCREAPTRFQWAHRHGGPAISAG